jgi:putative ABC transport system permease protein
METLLQDIRYGFRVLRKSPAFTAVAVFTLALGIGANTAIFSVIQALILRPLPYRDSDRIVLLKDADDPENGGFLYRDYENLKSQGHALMDFAIYYRDSGFSRVTLSDGIEPEFAQGAFVSADFFPLMGVEPALGRTFTPHEESQHAHVVLLSHGLWVRKFGASPSAIGSSVRINGVASQIIGVMPEAFQFPASDQQFWMPLTANSFWGDPSLLTVDSTRARGFYNRWQIVARLKPGVSLAQANAVVGGLFNRLIQTDPDLSRGNGIKVEQLSLKLSSDTRLALLILFIAVWFVLLVACMNVANLLLARGATRQTEMAVRMSLGAGPGRLTRQLITESLLLALLSGGLGLFLAYVGLHVTLGWAPKGIPRLGETRLDGPVLAVALATSLLATILCGLVPAWKISRGAGTFNLANLGSGRSSQLKRTRRFLVVTELSLTVVLLIGAGLLIRSLRSVEQVDLGFEPSQVLTLNIQSPSGSASQTTFYDTLSERLRSIPGIRAVGAINGLFETGKLYNLGLRAIDGRAPEPSTQWTPLKWNSVRGDFFPAMGIQLLSGRYFTQEDNANSPLVAIIDQSMAQRYWPDENPLGMRFKGQDHRGKNDDWITVVGVVSDTRRSGLERSPASHVYEPSSQAIDGDKTPDLVVRFAGEPGGLSAELRNLVRQLAPDAVLSPVTTLDQQLSDQLSLRRFQTLLLALFSLIALLLASVGVFGVLNYSVAQRTREIGIRMALGARRADVLLLVMREGTKLAAAGLALGVVAAAGLTKFMSSLLFGITSTDVVTFSSVAVLLMAVAIVASFVPSRRATKVDPIVALRYE